MSTPTDTARKCDALIDRLLQSSTGMFDIFTTYLGDRLGLYPALAAAQLMVGAVSPLAAIVEAFRTGAGAPLAEYGVHARLQSDPPARIAEIGGGAGWASIGLALAYPLPWIDGFENFFYTVLPAAVMI